MRSLILSLVLGAASLGVLAVSASPAEAQRYRRSAPPYYSYSYPGYAYSYSYANPSYSYYWDNPGYYASPGYYGSYPGYTGYYYSPRYRTYYTPGYNSYYWGY